MAVSSGIKIRRPVVAWIHRRSPLLTQLSASESARLASQFELYVAESTSTLGGVVGDKRVHAYVLPVFASDLASDEAAHGMARLMAAIRSSVFGKPLRKGSAFIALVVDASHGDVSGSSVVSRLLSRAELHERPTFVAMTLGELYEALDGVFRDYQIYLHQEDPTVVLDGRRDSDYLPESRVLLGNRRAMTSFCPNWHLAHERERTYFITCTASQYAWQHELLDMKEVNLEPDVSLSRVRFLLMLPDLLERMNDTLARGHHVFVHCEFARNRSVAIVLAFIMWRRRLSYQGASETLRLRGHRVATPAEARKPATRGGYHVALQWFERILVRADYRLDAVRDLIHRSHAAQFSDLCLQAAWYSRTVPGTTLAPVLAPPGGEQDDPADHDVLLIDHERQQQQQRLSLAAAVIDAIQAFTTQQHQQQQHQHSASELSRVLTPPPPLDLPPPRSAVADKLNGSGSRAVHSYSMPQLRTPSPPRPTPTLQSHSHSSSSCCQQPPAGDYLHGTGCQHQQQGVKVIVATTDTSAAELALAAGGTAVDVIAVVGTDTDAEADAAAAAAAGNGTGCSAPLVLCTSSPPAPASPLSQVVSRSSPVRSIVHEDE